MLIPVQAEYYALEALAALLRTMAAVQRHLNPDLMREGLLLTMLDRRTNLSRDVERQVRTHFGSEVFETVVPRNVRLAEAPSFGQPILQYDIKSRGAEAYLDLARELLERMD